MNSRSGSLSCLLALALSASLFAPARAAQSANAKDGKNNKTSPVKPVLSKPGKSAMDPVLADAIKNAPPASQYPNSAYIRLLDLGTVDVKSDGTTVAEYRVTYKLYKNNETSRRMAEVVLPYNASYQELKVLSAKTVKKDGTIIDVKPEDMRDGGVAGDYLMYDDAHGINFSMPGIEDDCVIDYTFKMITHPMFMPGQFTTYWAFSGFEPVGVSRLTLNVPADKPLKIKAYNDKLEPIVTSSVDGRTTKYVWEKKNLDPLDFEPAMPHSDEVKIWMEASSLGSWQDVACWFWGLQQPQTKTTQAITATVKTLVTGKATDEDKARAIYDWVANKTRYVGLEFGISAYKPHPAADVHDKMYGDCKDKANLLITMLGLAGIKAHPVLLHAGERRIVGDGLPTLNAFNHCIAVADVNNKEVWLDATAETCAYGDIPDSDRGVQALVVRDGKGQFETIPTYQTNENGLDIITKIVMQADGSAKTESEAKMRGEFGQSIRYSVREVTPDKRKEVMQGIAGRLGLSGNVKDFGLPDGSDKTGPFVMKMSLDAAHYGKLTGKSLLILPVVSSVNEMKKNPYSSDKRVWPIVEEDTSSMHSETTLVIPDGYDIDDAPGDVDLTCPIQEYHRKITKSADGKTLTIVDTFLSKPGKVAPADYAKVRGFYDEILKANDDQIVLKKK